MSDSQPEGSSPSNPSGNPHWRAPSARLPVIPAPVVQTAPGVPAARPVVAEKAPVSRAGEPVASTGRAIDVDSAENARKPSPWANPNAAGVGASTVVGSMFAAGWSPTAWRMRALGGR